MFTMKLVSATLLFLAISSLGNCLSLAKTKNTPSKVVYLNKNAGETIRLDSVLSYDLDHQKVDNDLETRTLSRKQIFWIFKRIYSMPTFSNRTTGQVSSSIETSQDEQMISLDLEVESNLRSKYSISGNVDTSEVAALHYDLIIRNLTYADSGLYVCNQWNKKTIYYQLVVSSPVTKPEIRMASSRSLKSNDLIAEGSDVSIKCQTKNAYPYPSIQWFMNRQEISPNGSVAISYELLDMKSNKIESTLTIGNITSAYHLTNFTCQLFQSNTSSMPSKRAVSTYTLNIAFKPIIKVALINKESKNKILPLDNQTITLFNETDVVFKSQFTANPQEARTKWILDGAEQENVNANEFSWLKRTNRMANTKSMLLKCQVENSAGVSEITYTIIVAYAPRILVPASAVTYDINELTQFQLTCQVSASPSADRVKWLYFSDKESTQDNFKVASNTSLLQIPSVTHSLVSGYFVCLATNKMTDSFGMTHMGKVLSRRVQLNVKFMPQMHVPFKKIAANLTKVTMDHSTFKQNITCRSLANPAPEFTWYKDGMQLFQTESETKYVIRTSRVEGETSQSLYESTLTINELGILDMNRNYECEATNSLGSNRAKVELVPMSKPDQPTNLKSTFVNFMTASLTWEAGFNGGITQYFVLQLNDTSYNIDNSTCSEESDHICVAKTAEDQVNVHNLRFDSLYNIEVYAVNSMGKSGSSNLIKIETNDLSESDAYLLPVFDTLFLNVPENRLEFTLAEKPSIPAHYCFQISTNLGNFNECLPVSSLQSRQDFNLDLIKDSIDLQSISSMHVVTCFQVAPEICSMKPTRASLVNSYGQQPTQSQTANIQNPSFIPSFEYSIPLALIIGISVCIVTMLILLLLIVCYCIRRRSLKISKSLLSVSDKDSGSSQRPLSGFSNSIESDKKSHLNKTFNIDIGSISAPINSNLTASSASSDLNNSAGYGTGGSGLNVVNGSMTSSINENLQDDSQGSKSHHRVPFTAALSSTTSNLINNSIGRHKLNEILVIEDGEQRPTSKCLKTTEEETKQTSLSKSSSTTGVSNCSSNVPNNQQYYDFMSSFDHQNSEMQTKGQTYIETYNHNSSSSTGSNSDPIAINNSLSSANSSHADNSPTYGYNVTNATTTAMPTNKETQNFEDQDNLLYIRTGIDQKSFTMRSQQQQQDGSQPILRQNKSCSNNSVPSSSSSSGVSCVNKHNSFHGGQFTQESGQPESGYSTPSRHKKVVYEVIV